MHCAIWKVERAAGVGVDDRLADIVLDGRVVARPAGRRPCGSCAVVCALAMSISAEARCRSSRPTSTAGRTGRRTRRWTRRRRRPARPADRAARSVSLTSIGPDWLPRRPRPSQLAGSALDLVAHDQEAGEVGVVAVEIRAGGLDDVPVGKAAGGGPGRLLASPSSRPSVRFGAGGHRVPEMARRSRDRSRTACRPGSPCRGARGCPARARLS